MSIHLSARQGDIAASVLLPGDPLRAKYIAENFLEKASCYNEVRGMYGFTGFYKGKRVSVQGTGMGIPSISIYLNELISDFGAEKLIRIGTCGSMQPEIELKDVILAMSASTDSQINKIRFNNMDYAPTANFDLLLQAFQTAENRGIEVRIGNVLTSDTFYHDNPDFWKHWADYGIIAAEMETAALYTLAAKYKVQALSILTVSDNMIDNKSATSEERQKSFTQMMEIALEIA